MRLALPVTIPQAAVIPYRVNDRGDVEVLLVTSRRKKRWGIPKGIASYFDGPRNAARQEAVEEAGVDGKIDRERVGTYSYRKWGAKCEVKVFTMRVTLVHDEWNEKEFRDREWVSAEEAVRRISDKSVRKLV